MATFLFSDMVLCQSAELAAITPPRPVFRTADDTRIIISESPKEGIFTVDAPDGCHRIDVLNARGRVKHRLAPGERQLRLDRLRPGTWTVRAHLPEGILVRRFLVMKRGRSPWAMPSR